MCREDAAGCSLCAVAYHCREAPVERTLHVTLINRKNREAGSPEQAQIQPLPEKLITYAIPCYNSAEYMDHCITSIL